MTGGAGWSSRRGVHPDYREVIAHLPAAQSTLDVVEARLDRADGRTDLAAAGAAAGRARRACVVVQYPNFFGVVEDLAALAGAGPGGRRRCWSAVIAEPLALGLLEAAGRARRRHRRRRGAALRHPDLLRRALPRLLRRPRRSYVRQMPGRLVGETVDDDGQARLRADARHPRAAHPPREGDLQHLHQPGAVRPGGDRLPVACSGQAGAARAGRPEPADRPTLRRGAAGRPPGLRAALRRAVLQRVRAAHARSAGAEAAQTRLARGGHSSAGSASAATTRSSPRGCWSASPSRTPTRRWSAALAAAARCPMKRGFEAEREAWNTTESADLRAQSSGRLRVAVHCRRRPRRAARPRCCRQACPRGRLAAARGERGRRGARTSPACPRWNYGVDHGFYPLGSCTMKYNPKVNERRRRLPGLPTSTRCTPPDDVAGARSR